MPEKLHTLVLPTPFPVGPINVYLAEGEVLTLIDTGPKTRDTLEALREGLAQLGYRLADIAQLIITHAHLDHFGLAQTIVTESGARVLTHRYNLYWLEQFEEEWRRRSQFYRHVFRQAGMPENMMAAIAAGTGMMLTYADPVPVDVLLEDGDVLSLAGLPWQVLHTPGHAGGLICLYQEQVQLLLSSDHLLRDITSNPVLEPPGRDNTQRPRSLVKYLASLRRVEALDVDLVLPAHGEPIHDHCALIAQRFAFHQERIEHILNLIRDGDRTAYELCMELFPDLAPLDVFLGISEVIGHLDILEEQGQVKAVMREGVIRYRRASRQGRVP